MERITDTGTRLHPVTSDAQDGAAGAAPAPVGIHAAGADASADCDLDTLVQQATA